jgi:hypothetical protein
MPEDGLSREWVLRALAHPRLGPELYALGVRDISTFGGADVYVPEQHKSWVRRRITEEFGLEVPAEKDELTGGQGFQRTDYLAAGKLHKARKMTVDGIKQRRGLSTRRAHRIYRQLRAGAVISDGEGLQPGLGYRWDPALLDAEPPKYRLLRD